MRGISKRFICISHGIEAKILISLLIFIILFPIMFQGFSPTANAGMRKRFTPRISVYTEYDDNIDLVPYYEDSDWITMASPGFSLNLDSPKTEMSLDYETRFAFYQKNSDRDTIFHSGTANWGQEISRNLKLELRDIFSRSDDPILVGEEGQIEEVGDRRRIYYRNTGEISLSLQLGAESSTGLVYRNLYLDNKSDNYEDSIGHEFFFNLDTTFNPLFGIGLEFRINRGKFKQPGGFTGAGTEDFYDREGVITLNYRWHPSRSLFARYSLLAKKFDDPNTTATEFWLHQSSLGLSFVLSPHTNFSVEGGYFLQNFSRWPFQPSERKSEDGARFNIVLNTQKRKASVRLEINGGYEQDYFSSENLGSSEFKQVFGSIDYLLSENLTAFVSVNNRWNEFFRENGLGNRKDKVRRTSAGFYFLYSDWLTLLIEGTHSERLSNDWDVEFRDNRIMFRLTGAYPILF